MFGHLDRMTASCGNLPDVVGGLHDLRAAWLDGLFIGGAIAYEINVVVAGIHWPETVGTLHVVDEFVELLIGYIHDPQVGHVAAAIMLTPPDCGMPVEREVFAVRRVATGISPIETQR